MAFVMTPSPLAGELIDKRFNLPGLGGNVILRLGLNGEYAATAPRLETYDTKFDIVASPRLDFSDRLSLHSELRMETISPPTRDRFFEDHGIFVRKLFGTFNFNDRFSISAGKFTPSFALASLVTPGMFGNNYNKEIELIERVGFEGKLSLNTGEFGRHAISASAFFDDTSVLSNSVLNSRGQKRRADGGASNTESLESFTISMEGADIDALPGFRYKLGLIHQAKGDGDADHERGFAVAATQTLSLDDNTITLIGEVAPIWNFEGSEDHIVYTSGGFVFEHDAWTFVASGTHRWRNVRNGSNFNDYSQQVSIEYALENGFSIAAAHEFTRDRGVDSRRFGLRLNKIINFDEH